MPAFHFISSQGDQMFKMMTEALRQWGRTLY